MTATGNVLCFDFGLVRIGAAIADLETGIPHPLKTLYCRGGTPEHAQMKELIEQWQPRIIVIGCPCDNSPPVLLDGINRFITYIKKQFNLPVVKADEAYSSIEAKSILKQQRQNHFLNRIEKPHIDKIAACLILESWLKEKKPDPITE